MKKKLLLTAIAALFLSSCGHKDYIYYKSKCACKELPNYADIKRG